MRFYICPWETKYNIERETGWRGGLKIGLASVFWTKNIELSAVFHRFSITTATTAILVMDKVHETHSERHNRPKMTAFALHASF